MKNGTQFNVEDAVRRRYAEGAEAPQAALCCPVAYQTEYLKAIPKEILEKDYGCGDPSAFLEKGDVVLDLGSGGGKICFIASQVVGPTGRVIGVDFNPAMLNLARKYQNEVGRHIGWHNVEFRRGRIQDLKTNLDRIDKRLKTKSIQSLEDWMAFEAERSQAENRTPLVTNESVDIVISNCVLNLVRPEDKKQLFGEMHRVLKHGGRVAISDIVSDEEVPQGLKDDPELWSGCISGAFQEKAFIRAFEEAGFYGITIEKRDETPWQTVHGIEFRSVTVTAFKGKEGACWERNQAVIYKGPWKQVEDDDCHVLRRGVPTAVCDKTFQIFTKMPYVSDLIPVPPREVVPHAAAKPFNCAHSVERDPRETKGVEYEKTEKTQSSCMEGSCC
jgi:arsenite methyltransferase